MSGHRAEWERPLNYKKSHFEQPYVYYMYIQKYLFLRL